MYTTRPSSLPNPLDGFRKPNIIRLKLVESNSNADSENSQDPVESGSSLWHAPPGEVIGDARLEADMGVYEDSTAEKRVCEGVESSCDEGGDCQWD